MKTGSGRGRRRSVLTPGERKSRREGLLRIGGVRRRVVDGGL